MLRQSFPLAARRGWNNVAANRTALPSLPKTLSVATMSTTTPRIVYLNGDFVPETEAKISVFDRGFMFSDSVYEVTSVLDGKLVDFEGHMTRLQRSLRELNFHYVPNADEYLAIHRELLQRNQHLQEGVVYWQVTHGVTADRSFTYSDSVDSPMTPTVLGLTQPMHLVDSPLAERGLRVVSIPDLRWKRCDIKTTQLLYQAQGKMQAKAAGVDDAWMVDPRTDLVTEGTSNNAFIIPNDGSQTIVTRAADNDILHGITRAAVVRLCHETSWRMEERPFSVTEVQEAAEAFCTSSSNFVMPVVEMDGKVIGDGKPGPITRRLREIYIEESRKHAV